MYVRHFYACFCWLHLDTSCCLLQEIDDEKKLKRTLAEKEEEERHMTEINMQVAGNSHMLLCL